MRLGRIRFVAFDAQHGCIEFGRNDARWVIRVLRQRPMAGLAGHPGVLPGLFFLKNVAVTRLARAMACEGHGQGRDLANGIAAIMSILAKAAGNKVGTQNREQGNRDQEDRRYSEKVLGILEVLHSSTGIWPAWLNVS